MMCRLGLFSSGAALAALLCVRSLRCLRTARKRIYLIRHGQSTFNKAMDDYFEQHPDVLAEMEADPEPWWNNPNHWDPGTIDSPLTTLGVQQAAKLPPCVNDMHVQLICVSPLTRALHTCALAFDLLDGGVPPVPVMVVPQLAERLNSSCDVGQAPHALRKAFGHCPAFDFNSVPENWWYHGKEFVDPPRLMEAWPEFVQRVNELKAWVKARPESAICLVCHAVLINQFTGTWVENCSVTPVDL